MFEDMSIAAGPMGDEIAIRVVIEGRVQGVWYRGWTMDQADELGLRGWVRNRRDGTVEALFAGDEGVVRRMIELCWEGPPLARVARVREFVEEGPVGPGFRQLPTT
jgi:acylphosphatase